LTNTNLKTGRRLQQIEQMITKHYDHIWDCCCDHGLLGFSLLNAQVAETVHFVDIVPDLMTDIEGKLQNHWQGSQQAWQVHCLDAAELPLKQLAQTDKHLIIIAGIGGELLIEIMRALLPLCTSDQIEFVLCPVHHNYKVRQFLIAHQLGLINESLVAENKRFYELLHVSRQSLKALSSVGSVMWDFNNPMHRKYLDKTIHHYQRSTQNSSVDAHAILNQYLSLRKNTKAAI
jgi:tRNA (adenine22-N1)-methyltransferase